jgi:peptidyl-prolyl cis-trans isomerase D
MIGSIRRHAQSNIFKIVLWLALFSLVGVSFLGVIPFRKSSNVQAVATVGDYGIGIMEYRRKFFNIAHLIQEIKKIYGPEAEALLSLWGVNQDPEHIALEQLVQEKVLQSAADSVTTAVSKEYIEHKLQDPIFVNESLGIPPQVFDNGVLKVDVLVKYLERMGISQDDFESLVKEAVQRSLLQQLVQGATYVSQDALKDKYQQSYSKRKYGLLTVSMNGYLKKAHGEKVTDESLKKFFDTHRETYRVPEKRSGIVWEFMPDEYGIVISDNDIEAYYNKRKNMFIEKPEEITIRRVVLKIQEPEKSETVQRKRTEELALELKQKPELFEKKAKELSQAQEKGDLITVKKGEKDPLFDRAAFALTKTDALSPVIKTPEGFEIIKLISKKETQYKDLKSVRSEIEKTLRQERFKRDFMTDAQRIISQARDVPAMFTNFIKDKKGKESKLEHVAQDGAGVKSQKLFTIPKVSDKTFYQDKNSGFITELAGVEKSFIPELSAVKDRVAQDFYIDKAQAAMREDVRTIQKKLSQESLEKAAQAIGGSVVTTDWINPQDNGTLKPLETNHIPVQQALALIKPKRSLIHIEKDNGYLVMLKEIEPLDEQNFNKKKKDLEVELLQNELQTIYPEFIKSLRSHMKVEVNRDLLRRASHM